MSFPAVTLLDSFKREETPLGGPSGAKEQWKTWYILTGGLGYCIADTDWENASTMDIEGAYWSPTEFEAPCAVAICRDLRISDTGDWSIWACVTEPTTANVSGYRVKMK